MDHVHDAVRVGRVVFKGALRLFVVVEVGLGADFARHKDVRIGHDRVGDVGARVRHHQFVARLFFDVAVELRHIGCRMVALRADFGKEVAVDFVLAVELQVFVHFCLDFFNRPRLVHGADIAEVFDANRVVVVDELDVVAVGFFTNAAGRVDDGIRHLAAARLVYAVPVGVGFPATGGVFVGGDNHRLRADCTGERLVARVDVAHQGVRNFHGVGFRAFAAVTVVGINGEVFGYGAFRDNHALDVPGEVGIAGVGAAVLDAHVHADVFAGRLVKADGVGRLFAFKHAGLPGEGDARRIGCRRRDEVAAVGGFRYDSRREVANRFFRVAGLVGVFRFGAQLHSLDGVVEVDGLAVLFRQQFVVAVPAPGDAAFRYAVGVGELRGQGVTNLRFAAEGDAALVVFAGRRLRRRLVAVAVRCRRVGVVAAVVFQRGVAEGFKGNLLLGVFRGILPAVLLAVVLRFVRPQVEVHLLVVRLDDVAGDVFGYFFAGVGVAQRPGNFLRRPL